MTFVITDRTPSLLFVGQIIADIPALSLFQNGLSDESERFYIPINPIFPHFSLYTLSTLRFEILPARTIYEKQARRHFWLLGDFFHHRLSCEWWVIFVFFSNILVNKPQSQTDAPTRTYANVRCARIRNAKTVFLSSGCKPDEEFKSWHVDQYRSKELTLSNWLKIN